MISLVRRSSSEAYLNLGIRSPRPGAGAATQLATGAAASANTATCSATGGGDGGGGGGASNGFSGHCRFHWEHVETVTMAAR